MKANRKLKSSTWLGCCFLIFMGLLCCYTGKVNGQFAIIQDKDGYTNVRSGPGSDFDAINRIYDYEVFFYDTDMENWEDGWVPVSVSKNKYSLGQGDFPFSEGFIHQSRLKDIETVVFYKGNDVKIQYFITPFTKKGRYIEKVIVDGQEFINSIDGRYVWGLSTTLPEERLSKIVIQIGDQHFTYDGPYVDDLFQVGGTPEIRKIGSHYYGISRFGDGENHYQVVWVFNQSGLVQRLVGASF